MCALVINEALLSADFDSKCCNLKTWLLFAESESVRLIQLLKKKKKTELTKRQISCCLVNAKLQFKIKPGKQFIAFFSFWGLIKFYIFFLN